MKLVPAAALLAMVVVAPSWGGERASGWSRTDLKPVSQPAAVKGNFVFYAVRNDALNVVALHAGSGRTAWAHPATPSEITAGVAAMLAVVSGNVVYLRATSAPLAEVVASDASTGRVIWHSVRGIFNSWPEVCVDDATEICLSGTFASHPDRSEVIRLAAATGKVTRRVSVGSFGARELGPGLYDPGLRAPEYLEAIGRGIMWRRRLSAIFTLPAPSTDWGWNIDRVGRAGLFVGSAGWPPDRRAQGRMIFDAARTMTAGFRIGSGLVVWRDKGSRYVCTILPCVGGAQPAFTSPDSGLATGPSVGVRLRETGTLSAPAHSFPTASKDARVVVEGFAPGTGKTSWRFDAGRNVELLTLARLPPQIAAHTLVLRDRSGGFAGLNLGSGSHHRIGSGAHAWCREAILYKLKLPTRAASQYVGQNALYACDASGHRVATPKSVPTFVGEIGASASGIVAWSDTGGIFAARSK